MKLPFSIKKYYTTSLSYYDIHHELENLMSVKSFGGLRVDKYNYDITATTFFIQRYCNGITAFLEYFPLIKGEIVNQNPTRIFIKFIPRYFRITFFAVFALVVFFAGIFVNEWTINGIKRMPTSGERLFTISLGSGIPVLWCYLQCIRPIKKAEKWIVEKLSLDEEG